jgi:hypothetical protein
VARRLASAGEKKLPTRGENLRTIGQVADQCPAFSEAALRKLILHAPLNGLEPAIVRLGRRVLIDSERFNEWLNQHRGLSA